MATKTLSDVIADSTAFEATVSTSSSLAVSQITKGKFREQQKILKDGLIAIQNEIANLGDYLGDFNSSSGALPTNADIKTGTSKVITANDFFKISVAGVLPVVGSVEVDDKLVRNTTNDGWYLIKAPDQTVKVMVSDDGILTEKHSGNVICSTNVTLASTPKTNTYVKIFNKGSSIITVSGSASVISLEINSFASFAYVSSAWTQLD